MLQSLCCYGCPNRIYPGQSEKTCGIPPEMMVGSSVNVNYQLRDGIGVNLPGALSAAGMTS